MSIRIAERGSDPDHSKNVNRLIIIAVICISAVCAVALFFGIRNYMRTRGMQLVWNEIRTLADNPDQESETFVDNQAEPGTPNLVTTDTAGGDALFAQIDLASVQGVNPDAYRYIRIPDTNIDYPIMKEQEPYVYYYEKHDIYGNQTAYGSIFQLCDEQVGGADPTVDYLFGHHMSSGDMFTELRKFENKDFANDTPVYIYHGDYRQEWHVAAVCVVDKYADVFDFGGYELGSAEYAVMLEGLARNSEVSTDYALDKDQQILVLSTCKGARGTSNRLIVVCVKTRTATVLHPGGEAV